MKWLFVIKERYKLALYLTVSFVIIIAANLFERTQVNEVDKSIISMYKDRIIPAKDISMMLSYFYKNQLLLQEHMHTFDQSRNHQIENSMQANHQAIDSLIERFGKTFLVDKEIKALNDYRSKIIQYKKIEDHIVLMSKKDQKDEAYRHYQAEGQKAFQSIIQPIHQLADLQAYVGQELYKSSHEKLAGTRISSSLEIAIAIIIGLIVHLLLQVSTLINRKPQNHYLN